MRKQILMTSEEYLEAVTCPQCGSTETQYREVYVGDGYFILGGQCCHCGCRWENMPDTITVENVPESTTEENWYDDTIPIQEKPTLLKKFKNLVSRILNLL